MVQIGATTWRQISPIWRWGGARCRSFTWHASRSSGCSRASEHDLIVPVFLMKCMQDRNIASAVL